jgi:hypothetical protein
MRIDRATINHAWGRADDDGVLHLHESMREAHILPGNQFAECDVDRTVVRYSTVQVLHQTTVEANINTAAFDIAVFVLHPTITPKPSRANHGAVGCIIIALLALVSLFVRRAPARATS